MSRPNPNQLHTGPDGKSLVLGAVDLVELVGQTVRLKRQGKDYVGLCPFHNEKSPSFSVSPAKQFFYCYGCKAGGDALSFVMKRDRVEFKEALHLLADQYHVELPKFGNGKREDVGKRQSLLDAHSSAAEFYARMLRDPDAGVAAREYLKARGFTGETAKQFRLGVAPDGWDHLLAAREMKKFAAPLLAEGGLAKAREKGPGHYDTFRNRLMFPIRDETGRTIAFGGRVLPGNESPAKYLNSPETPLFHKSKCVFGLDLARKGIVETRTAVVVEGYTDVLMAHQNGVTNVVSVLGTALTPDHVKILRRFADRIVLLFDADTAGETATERAVELFLTQPVEIQIATMPAGVDPDEFLLKEGKAAFEALLTDKAEDALAYQWRQMQKRFTASGGELTGEQQAVDQYLNLLADARGAGPVDGLRWGAALARVSRLTGIPMDDLKRRFDPPKSAEPRRPSGRQFANNRAARPAPLAARERAERWLLGVLLNHPARWHDVQIAVQPQDFSTAPLRRLAELYWDHQRNEGEPVLAEFAAVLEAADDAESPGPGPAGGLVALAFESAKAVEAFDDPAKVVDDALDFFRNHRRRQEADRLVAQSRRGPSGADGPTRERDEVDVLRQIQERARRPDLQRHTGS